MPGVFRPIEDLRKHQELALRSIKAGQHTVVATGTGSGKTESFLLPIIDHCLKLRDEKAGPGVVAVLVYPMNALVNDQLEPPAAPAGRDGDHLRAVHGRDAAGGALGTGATHPAAALHPATELEDHREGRKELPLPFEECHSRADIQERRPRLLLTNYNQLELLLLRHKDLDLFQGAPLRFLVFDEVHTYTGSLGSEVACLIRRLRYLSGKQPDEVTAIGTSATVQDPEGKIDGPRDDTQLHAPPLRDQQGPDRGGRGAVPASPASRPGRSTTPPSRRRRRHCWKRSWRPRGRSNCRTRRPTSPRGCCRPPSACAAGKRRTAATTWRGFTTCWRPMPSSRHLTRSQDQARLLDEALNALRVIGGRQQRGRDDLIAELLAYLTLGALAQQDEEPLLRPKIHYFIQGYQGILGELRSRTAGALPPA